MSSSILNCGFLRRMVRLLVVVTLLGCFTKAEGAVVFNNGAPNPANAREMTHWVEADNFTLGGLTNVTDVRFWDLQPSPSNYAGSISWAIYANSAGSPAATPLFSGNTTAVTRAATGLTINGGALKEFVNDFSVGSISLAAGDYFLALHNGPLTNTISTNFFWEATPAGGSPNGQLDEAPFGDGFTGNGVELAFILFGNSPGPGGGSAVPLPPAIWSGLITTAVLACFRVRRRSV